MDGGGPQALPWPARGAPGRRAPAAAAAAAAPRAGAALPRRVPPAALNALIGQLRAGTRGVGFEGGGLGAAHVSLEARQARGQHRARRQQRWPRPPALAAGRVRARVRVAAGRGAVARQRAAAARQPRRRQRTQAAPARLARRARTGRMAEALARASAAAGRRAQQLSREFADRCKTVGAAGAAARCVCAALRAPWAHRS